MPSLPPLYETWVTQLLGAAPPSEPRSTCATCAMVARGPQAEDPGPHFLPEVKCCQFLPRLPNFLVGRILRDPELPPGLASIRARIADPTIANATGLGCTTEYADAFEAAKNDGRFGQVLDLRCPHYLPDSGHCGIWAHRESVCTTWFCKHSHGARSRHFWHTLQQLLRAAEDALARWCAQGLGADANWSTWAHQREAYYEACARRVEDLDWRDVQRIGGFELRFRARLLKEAWAGLQERGVPPVLVAGRIRAIPLPTGGYRVWGYSQYDPSDLPAEVVGLLSRFNGRTVEEVLREGDVGDTDGPLSGLVLDEAMLEHLFEARILDLPPEA